MNVDTYIQIKQHLIEKGYSWEIENIKNYIENPCSDANKFFKQYMWVVINSGMAYIVAVQIYHRILSAMMFKQPVEDAFKHKKKLKAIMHVNSNKNHYFHEYVKSANKIEYLETLPYIGKITKYHLARNLGVNCCKPDRHLVRIANSYNTTPYKLCEKLSLESGDYIGVVDVILWRAGNLKII